MVHDGWRIRVAVIGPTHPYKGGIAQHTTELAFQLTAADIETDIISWARQYPERLYPGQQRLDEPDQAPFERVRYVLSWCNPLTWKSVGRQLVGTADGVVLVLASPVQIPAYLMILHAAKRAADRAGRARPNAVVLAHNVLPHESRPGDRGLVRWLLSRADGVLVHSTHEQEIARRLSSVPVQTQSLPPHLPGGWPTELAELDRPARRTLLLFGLVRPYKGLDVLLRALARTAPDIRLLVRGEFWEPVNQYRRLVDELGLAGRVDIVPHYVPAGDVAGLLQSVDALVLPYRSATATQNIWLAFAHGLPAVVTDVGALPAQIEDGVDGYVVPSGDVEALAAAIDRLYQPGELLRLRTNVRAQREGDAWPRYLDALLGLLRVPNRELRR